MVGEPAAQRCQLVLLQRPWRKRLIPPVQPHHRLVRPRADDVDHREAVELRPVRLADPLQLDQRQLRRRQQPLNLSLQVRVCRDAVAGELPHPPRALPHRQPVGVDRDLLRKLAQLRQLDPLRRTGDLEIEHHLRTGLDPVRGAADPAQRIPQGPLHRGADELHQIPAAALVPVLPGFRGLWIGGILDRLGGLPEGRPAAAQGHVHRGHALHPNRQGRLLRHPPAVHPVLGDAEGLPHRPLAEPLLPELLG
jgi:hypothetical protein